MLVSWRLNIGCGDTITSTNRIAPFASIDTWLSVAPVAQALAIIDTGRNCNLDFLSPGDKTGSIAVRTFFFDNLAGTAAVRTGLNILDLAEEGLFAYT